MRGRRGRGMNALPLAAARRGRGRAGQGAAGPRRGGADRRRRRRRARRASCASPPRIRRPAGSKACPGPSPWSGRNVDAMDTLLAPAQALLGPAWPVGLDAGEDRRHRGAADPGRGLPDARRAQGHRLDAGAHRPQPRRAARAAAAVRRRLQADLQGDHRPDRAPTATCSSSRRCWRSRPRWPPGRSCRSPTAWCSPTSTPACSTSSR